MANFISSICNLLLGPYKRNEYRKVILPLTVLRRFDYLLAPTKEAALEKHREVKLKPDRIVQAELQGITKHRFYNLSKKQFDKDAVHSLLDDPACGTGGMLSVAEGYIRKLNADANPNLYGQDWNDEAWTERGKRDKEFPVE